MLYCPQPSLDLDGEKGSSAGEDPRCTTPRDPNRPGLRSFRAPCGSPRCSRWRSRCSSAAKTIRRARPPRSPRTPEPRPWTAPRRPTPALPTPARPTPRRRRTRPWRWTTRRSVKTPRPPRTRRPRTPRPNRTPP
ncbi:MAG: hypothetical protein CMH57_00025 [Myxococcales bacterium]|nr:hypothetical protein [Myxococcales bacterium]